MENDAWRRSELSPNPNERRCFEQQHQQHQQRKKKRRTQSFRVIDTAIAIWRRSRFVFSGAIWRYRLGSEFDVLWKSISGAVRGQPIDRSAKFFRFFFYIACFASFRRVILEWMGMGWIDGLRLSGRPDFQVAKEVYDFRKKLWRAWQPFNCQFLAWLIVVASLFILSYFNYLLNCFGANEPFHRHKSKGEQLELR